MKNEPRVLAICLTAERPEMTQRAVDSFSAQTYANKKLLLWDSSADFGRCYQLERENVVHVPAGRQSSIGALRNAALGFWTVYDIAVTWDSDDWSHPNRIAEQVAHLQASGADVVGYSELLFWRSLNSVADGYSERAYRDTVGGVSRGESWLWKNARGYAGTSFCYWRKTWEKKPFPDLPKNGEGTGEDYQWAQGLNMTRVSSMYPYPHPDIVPCGQSPRIIASIHGGNTMKYNDLEKSPSWKRVPEWDTYARERMAL